ncbi:MAG: hypothetical protein Ta2E_07800 [Mycoplasmoidaceae bacterium]|nr:MAG: hypothetical protein Ta2E_07800 [Mycoplasmoidaceae bacterium]
MKSFAIQKSIHISPRKLGLVCDLVRGKNAIEAQTILTNLDKKGAKILLKLLNSAIANGTNNFGMNLSKMYILETVANEAAMLKRTLPRAKGSASMLRKRHSHLSIVVSDDQKDRLTLHKKPNGKSKNVTIKSAASKKSTKVINNAPKSDNKKIIRNEEVVEIDDKQVKSLGNSIPEKFPEVETPIEKLSPQDEIKIAVEIEKEEEEKGAEK